MITLLSRCTLSAGLFACASPIALGQFGVLRVETAGDGSRAVVATKSALLPEDTNVFDDVYLHDFVSRTTTLVSVSTQGGGSQGQLPLLTADGELVVFFGYGPGIVEDPPSYGTYLRDVPAGTTSLLLPLATPMAMTADGRFVAMTVVVTSTPLNEHLLLLDRSNGSLEQINVNDAGEPTGQPSGWEDIRTVAISADGRYVAFASLAANVDPLDTDSFLSVYVRDRAAADTFLASEANGTNLAGMGSSLAMSRDGRVLAFGNGLDVYVRNLVTSEVGSVSIGPASGFCVYVDVDGIADDGSRLLLTERFSQNFIPGQGCVNGAERPWIVELATGATLAGPIASPPASTGLRSLSADGQVVVSVCGSELCRWVVPATSPSPWFTCHGKTSSIGCVPHAGFVGEPSLSGASSLAITASALRNQTSAMVLWGLGSQSTPFGGGTLCVAAPLHRTTLQNSGGTVGSVDCSGAISFEFDATYLAQNGFGVGTVAHAQVYGRDPGFAPPENVQLSSAVAFTVGP